MKGSDKFIIGIVAAIALLVIVAFTVAFLRPKPTYQPEDTPEGVAHNYLFALRQGDYARAYSYLSPKLEGYPDSVGAFAENIWSQRWNFGVDDNSITSRVAAARHVTDEHVLVSVSERQLYQNGLFGSGGHSHTFDMALRRENGQWKIITSDFYWASCWEEPDGCR
ncbi:MAG: hypothetical protein JW850_15080 [Thermoflexales bacterium]|nr:hypothetical protein [Thermoflexales bacterium]